MAPPRVAVLPLMLVLTTTSDPAFETAPPLIDRPLTMARSWISVDAPPLTRNGWAAPPPTTIFWVGPLPMISRSLVVLSVPALSRNALPLVFDANEIRSEDAASPAVQPPTGRFRLAAWTASRSEQAP